MDRPEPTNQHGHRLEADGRVGDDPTVHAPEPWGIRRLRVAQPPRAGRPRRGAPAAMSTPSAGPAVDPDPVTMQLFASPPSEPHRVVPPPPTAWRTVSTVSVLRSILPPFEPFDAPTPPEPPAASELRAAILAAHEKLEEKGPVLASPFAQATPVADTRARLPGSAPLAVAPTTTVAVAPWPSETGARVESGSAQQSVAKRSLRGRALLILMRQAVGWRR
jgi:hypothetical protein